MTAHGPRQARILGRQAGNEVAGLGGRAALQAPFRLDHDQAAEAGSGRVGIDIAPVVRGVDRPATAGLDAAVALAYRLGEGVGTAVAGLRPLVGEHLHHGRV